MRRSKWWLVVPAASALLVVGCAHCDTCDDFPRSCSNKYVQGSYTPWVGPGGQVAESVTAPAQMTVPLATTPVSGMGAPAATPNAGPFSGSDAVPPPADTSKPAVPADEKPSVPAEPPLSPPPANPPATGTTSIK